MYFDIRLSDYGPFSSPRARSDVVSQGPLELLSRSLQTTGLSEPVVFHGDRGSLGLARAQVLACGPRRSHERGAAAVEWFFGEPSANIG